MGGVDAPVVAVGGGRGDGWGSRCCWAKGVGAGTHPRRLTAANGAGGGSGEGGGGGGSGGGRRGTAASSHHRDTPKHYGASEATSRAIVDGEGGCTGGSSGKGGGRGGGSVCSNEG